MNPDQAVPVPARHVPLTAGIQLSNASPAFRPTRSAQAVASGLEDQMRELRIVVAMLGSAAIVACDAGAQQGGNAAAQAPQQCAWCGAAEAPAGKLHAEAVLAGAEEPGLRLIVTGVVYRPDGRTPAANVLLYAYQTNAEGVYPRRGDEQGNARRHGYLRGWLRTDAAGRYQLTTIRPASYPGSRENTPAHIHITVTPPGGEEDWVDTIVFEDDPLVTSAWRARQQNRGGSGVVRALPDAGGVLHATRDIVLEQWP
jgi:protocatechuate 3,4-dioxygenase, beta subunit